MGSKHHLLTDANGTPPAARLSGANRHNVTQLLPLVDAVPPVAGKPGRPRERLDQVQGDLAYRSDPHRWELLNRFVPLVPPIKYERRCHQRDVSPFQSHREDYMRSPI